MKLKIGIVGLGLIGGSIEKKLQNLPDKYEILSVSTSQQREYQIEDLKNTDIIFLCSQQSKILKDLELIAKIISQSGAEGAMQDSDRAFAKTIITDVASTKLALASKAQELGLKNFIPGHPMAGTEHQGYESSFPEIFQGAKWILEESSPRTAKLEKLIREDLGAEIVTMDAETHDKAVAMVSHLPLVLSIGLADMINNFSPASKVIGPGFKSMTRLANGNTQMSKEIVSLNRTNIKTTWELYKQEIDSILNIYGDELALEFEEVKKKISALAQ